MTTDTRGERQMTETTDRAALIATRAEAATKGPWSWWNLEGVDQGWDDNGPNLDGPADSVIGGWGHDAWGVNVLAEDADFIAHARDDIPWLLERLADAERQLERQAETVTTLRMFCAALRCVGHKGSGGVTAGGIADLITEILAPRA